MIRRQITLKGLVQGVGFRPFVYQLANALNLRGFVTNKLNGVSIEAFGLQSDLDLFESKLLKEAPAHALIESIETISLPAFAAQETELKHFAILASQNSQAFGSELSTDAPPDLGLCQECLTELFDPTNRRYLFPFINCTHCGPRYSIIQKLPYDRQNTSMSSFCMCSDCNAEYESPDNGGRRFHAQANTCEACGPSLSLIDSQGAGVASRNESISECAKRIKQGKIVAIKGIGGFHLVCDAKNASAVERLRTRKSRPDKPFAIMALNTASLKSFVDISKQTETLIESAAAPIVLTPKKTNSDNNKWIVNIAPQVSDVGCLLPYTPIHYLLFHALSYSTQKHSIDQNWLDIQNDNILIVTSANHAGEPIISDNQECVDSLSNIADYFLIHDRDIIARCDDAVIQSGLPSCMIRYARGYAPQPVRTRHPINKSILACGAHLKNTFCLTTGAKSYLSPYIGELDTIESYRHFSESITHYLRLYNIKPDAIVCDTHPDFQSTRYAETFSLEHSIPLIKIQHHRAHIAAVLAEHSEIKDLEKNSAILGLSLDGVGLGDQNETWGGELFYGEPEALERVGHLSEVSLPGGDISTNQIWRIGAAILSQLAPESLDKLYGEQLIDPAVEQFILRGKHTKTSSAGRWFDAITSLLGLRQTTSFEGQAAMQLESMASAFKGSLVSKHLIQVKETGELSLYPLIPYLLEIEDIHEAAARFHIELIDGLLRWVTYFSDKYQNKTVVCSGGCFQNRMLREALSEQLKAAGFDVYLPKQIPVNDSGISLGQAWLASRLLEQQA